MVDATSAVCSAESSSTAQPQVQTGPFQFHQFPHLPLELQHDIWLFTLPRGRVITICPNLIHESSDCASRLTSGSFLIWKMMSNTAPPTALHVCHYSRLVALSKYRLGFDTFFTDKLVYWSPEIDTIYLKHKESRNENRLALILDYFRPSTYAVIQHLAVDLTWHHFEWIRANPVTFQSYLRRFTHLEFLELAIDPFGRIEDDGVPEVVLHGAIETPVSRLGGFTPSQLVEQVTAALESDNTRGWKKTRNEVDEENGEESWRWPEIEGCVVVRKSRKKDPWRLW